MSVVIAVRNAASTVEACLKSVLEQTGLRVEVLVADGGSTDDTWQRIRRFSDRLAWTRSQPDSGIYDAWNQAVNHANGTYICFLGADDRLNTRNALGTLFSAAQHEEDLVSCKGHYEMLRLGQSYEFGGPWDWQDMRNGMCVEHHALLHHRSLFERVGLFDTSYRIAGDYDFLLRCGPETTAAYVPKALVAVGTDGVSQKQVMRRLWERRRAQLAHRVLTRKEASFRFAFDLAKNHYHTLRRKFRKGHHENC